MEVGTIGGTVESASTVVLAEKTIPIIPTLSCERVVFLFFIRFLYVDLC